MRTLLLRLACMAGLASVAACAAQDEAAISACALDGAGAAAAVAETRSRWPEMVFWPDLEYGYRRLPLRATGTDGWIVTTSWGGPPRGVMVLVGCDGAVRDALPVGWVQELTLDTNFSRHAPVRLTLRTGTGTGWVIDGEARVRVEEGRLYVAWVSDTFEGSYQAESVGAYERRGVVSRGGGDTLVHRVTTTPLRRGEGDWIPDPSRASERISRYVYDPAARCYVPIDGGDPACPRHAP